MNIAEFREQIKLSPEDLDCAALAQPDLFFEWSAKAAKARIEMERGRSRMEAKESELSLACRDNPETFGIVEKVTEAAIQHAIKVQADYQDLREGYFRLREESLMLDRAVDALEQRKRMIEMLISLHGQQYFATPSLGRNLVDAWGARQRALTQRQKELLADRKTRSKVLERMNGEE